MSAFNMWFSLIFEGGNVPGPPHPEQPSKEIVTQLSTSLGAGICCMCLCDRVCVCVCVCVCVGGGGSGVARGGAIGA